MSRHVGGVSTQKSGEAASEQEGVRENKEGRPREGGRREGGRRRDGRREGGRQGG
jgi:hypothetical protein